MCWSVPYARVWNHFDSVALHGIEVRFSQGVYFREAVEDLPKKYEEPKKGKKW